MLLAFGFGAIPVAHADGLIIVHEPYWWPEPRPPHPHPLPLPRPYAPLEVTYHHVNVKIDGQVATTSVDQEFYNPDHDGSKAPIVFPIPKGAQIDKFTMEIDGKQVEAELLPADKARRIYEDIVRKLRDPALLEYAGRDVFKVRIFPIEPNSKKRITLSYTQVLKADDGLVSYVLPLNTEKFSAKPIKNVSVKVELESKRPLKSIYSPSHSVEVKRHGPNRATVGYEATDVQPDTDFALYFAPEKDELGVNLLTCRTGNEDGYFLLLASPGVDVKEQAGRAQGRRVRARHLRLDGRQEAGAGQKGAAVLRREPQRRRPLRDHPLLDRGRAAVSTSWWTRPSRTATRPPTSSRT